MLEMSQPLVLKNNLIFVETKESCSLFWRSLLILCTRVHFLRQTAKKGATFGAPSKSLLQLILSYRSQNR
jgi:hypothetical protein